MCGATQCYHYYINLPQFIPFATRLLDRVSRGAGRHAWDDKAVDGQRRQVHGLLAATCRTWCGPDSRNPYVMGQTGDLRNTGYPVATRAPGCLPSQTDIDTDHSDIISTIEKSTFSVLDMLAVALCVPIAIMVAVGISVTAYFKIRKRRLAEEEHRCLSRGTWEDSYSTIAQASVGLSQISISQHTSNRPAPSESIVTQGVAVAV
ncbi:hypothetical protein DL89DRAFT_309517 [Linderina pennispora]|uniref:Uncharacterized protein n=1 Tax=Linderina pennispora TaxID=61395 RepID=A0A1Y1WIG9_9FUNG|nr:uncharacterized protein DL89DRAFT_309517 [Linderina pennispora]ORX73327.1 hypothetical protein DL89DRAFT_309517 [Linderina pennispora]